MKKIMPTVMLALAICTLMPFQGTSQGMPVYDNTNFISLSKQLIESAKQTSQLLKTVEFLQQQKENIEKVNRVVKQLKAVKALYRNNQRLYRIIQKDLRDILNSPYIRAHEIEAISESFSDILDNSVTTLEYVKQVLSSGGLKMTDGERTAILKQKELESREMVAEIENKARRYREIISFRKMQDIVNNRITDY